MPTLGNALDFAKYEGRNLRAHQLGTAPSSPVTGQLYYNTADNTLYWWDGTQWVSSRGTTPPDATSSVKGIVQLAGDLAGTAASPQIAAGVIVDADVNGSAAIAESKLNLATDAAVGTGSRRTLGSGAQQAMPGNRTLDAITAPAADLSMNSKKITNLLDPASAQDAATKNYVDNAAQGLDAKASVKAATTANITNLAGGAPNTLDGVTLAANDRVLVKNQTTQSQNGIYVVTTLGTGSNGTWTRASDMDAWTEVPAAYTWVEQGTTLADTGWVCTADQGGTIGSTSITWTQFNGSAAIIDGAGLLKTGNTFDVGAGPGITVNADTIQVANNGITNAMIADGAIDLATADVTNTLPLTKGGTGQTTAKAARETGLGSVGYYSSSTHGAGTTITITQATHGLRSTRAILVQVQDVATGAVEIPDIVVAANGDVTITYGASVSANSKLVTLVG